MHIANEKFLLLIQLLLTTYNTRKLTIKSISASSLRSGSFKFTLFNGPLIGLLRPLIKYKVLESILIHVKLFLIDI